MCLVEAVGSVVMALADAMVGRVQPQPHVEPNVRKTQSRWWVNVGVLGYVISRKSDKFVLATAIVRSPIIAPRAPCPSILGDTVLPSH